MRIRQAYARHDRPAVSFELFPPKNKAAREKLKEALGDLAALGPDFMTVTCGAGGTTRGSTLKVAARVQNLHDVPTACHLTCVGSSRSDLDDALTEIHDAGIRNIVALRGDPPQGETKFSPAPDGYSHAAELVAHIHDFTNRRGIERFSVAVAGYPEKHAEAPSLATDVRHLREKVDQGADAVITQLFFDNSDFFRFVDLARTEGVTVPIIPGLLPILSAKQVQRITSLCGARVPDRLQEELDVAGDDTERAREVGAAWCLAQAQALLARGVLGLHFYVLNESSQIGAILPQIR